MRLVPGSLFGRNLLLIVGLIVLAELASVLIFQHAVQRPRAVQFAHFARLHAEAVVGALATLPPERRAGYLAAVNRSPDMQIVSGREAPAGVPAPQGLRVRRALAPLWRELSPHYALRWEPAPARRLWLGAQVGDEYYWIGLAAGAFAQPLSYPLIAAWLVSGLLALAGAALIQQRLNRPLSELSEAAARVARGEPVPPLAEDGPLGTARVAASFNRMAASLAHAERERTLMLAGVSHDLRTPLTKLRLAVEMLAPGGDPGLVASAVRNIEAADQIIDQFIDYARVGQDEEATATDLNDIATAVAEAAALPEQPPITLDLGELPILALRPIAMRRLVANLVANAQRHAGGEVVLHTGTRGGEAELAVLDRGPGIPPEALTRIVQPFARLNAARGGKPGAGLGLAIADRVARLHGGRLLLENREGGGLAARVRLPLPGQGPFG